MDTNKMREQFEDWASGQFVMPVEVIKACRYEDTYANTVLNIAWRGWAASREAVVVALPAAEFGVSPEIEDDEEYEAAEAISMCEDAVLSRVRKHIEAQGLKVAP
ncbi:hypothetical protein [Pseudomonas sp. A014]|uniref:hypothetical protein n=1 Tax=Pseudomonas sp. A014 TaxID=3458058 RepID=UPI004035700D